MNDIEKAMEVIDLKEAIENLSHFKETGEICDVAKLDYSLKTAISALEKQIPKKVTDVVFKAKACIDDGELKCACAEKICNECEYRELFDCKEATVIINKE